MPGPVANRYCKGARASVKAVFHMTSSQANTDRWQADGPEEPNRMIRVGPDRLLEAVERLVSTGTGKPDRGHATRFLEYAAANGVRLDFMWSQVDRAGAIQATVLAVPSPGRTAMVFATSPRSPKRVPELGRLIDHVCRSLDPAEVHLAQVLLEPEEALHRQAFAAGGFGYLATLSYLERSIGRSAAVEPIQWPADASIEAYRSELDRQVLEALEISYEQTLDCPGLLGLRLTTDILDGHRATGRFDPNLWTLLRLGGTVAGILMLNPSPAHQTIELVYLGLAPIARGRGIGRKLLRHGLNQLAGRPERSVTLAVDERNAPALKLYQTEGFRCVLRRVAMIRPIAPPQK